jgi:hypothetical protein
MIANPLCDLSLTMFSVVIGILTNLIESQSEDVNCILWGKERLISMQQV